MESRHVTLRNRINSGGFKPLPLSFAAVSCCVNVVVSTSILILYDKVALFYIETVLVSFLPRRGSYCRREEVVCHGRGRSTQLSGGDQVAVVRSTRSSRTEIVDGRRASVAGRSTGLSRSGTIDIADGRRSSCRREIGEVDTDRSSQRATCKCHR